MPSPCLGIVRDVGGGRVRVGVEVDGEEGGGTESIQFFAGLLAGFGVPGGNVDFCSILDEAF